MWNRDCTRQFRQNECEKGGRTRQVRGDDRAGKDENASADHFDR